MKTIMRTQLMPALERELMARELLSGGKVLLVGISGGADSVALAHTVALLKETHDFSWMAVHVEHGLRGEASLKDAAFVQALCDDWRVPLLLYHVDAAAARNSLRAGLEEGARLLRYGCFEQAMAQANASALLLAHQQDDQAETVLMHLLRGSGPNGLSGMRSCAAFGGGLLIRPFLIFGHETLCAALKESGLCWQEDETNREPGCLRNQLRLAALPLLEGFVPGCGAAMGRTAQVMAQEEDWWQEETSAWLASHASLRRELCWLDRAALKQVHPAYQKRVLRRFWEEGLKALGLTPDRGMTALDQSATEAFWDCLLGTGGQAVNLPLQVRGERSAKRLFLIPPAGPQPMMDAPLSLPGQTRFSGFTLTASPWRPGMELGDGILTQALDSRELSGAVLRLRRPGDTFRLMNTAGKQPLKETLIDHHVDRPFRDRMILLARGSEVLWVPGLGPSGTAAVRPDTRRGMFFTLTGDLPWRRDM